MEIERGYHLTYCTNIHPGETWEDTFAALKTNLPGIKRVVWPDGPFGVGLRLSDLASRGLLQRDSFQRFREFLQAEGLYVFTINGFPFGGFHGERVKDKVHHPDWSSKERFAYTTRLFDILVQLLPADMEGGISTSPLGYKGWYTEPKALTQCLELATRHLAEVAYYLHLLEDAKGHWLHLDLEPEPDGLLENSREVVAYFQNWLLVHGRDFLIKKYKMEKGEAERILRRHLCICYDVCHFAVAFEEPEMVFKAFAEAGITIGKVQISAALEARFSREEKENQALQAALAPFAESTYLHQVVCRHQTGQLTQYPDLEQALLQGTFEEGTTLRTHFHVPIFMETYGKLLSTQPSIAQTLELLRQEGQVHHLEVETYTWGVLPPAMQLPLQASIARELQWVLESLEK